MSSSSIDRAETVAVSVSISGDSLQVDLSDGRTISAPIAWYPRLTHASANELSNWRLIGRGQGIHWPEIDEDISTSDLLAGVPSSESQRSLKQWLEAKSGRRDKYKTEKTDQDLEQGRNLLLQSLSSYELGEAWVASARFLMVFSRFEYALKSLGYVRQQGERVLIEWRRLAAETSPYIPLDHALLQEVAPLVAEPPAKQVVRQGHLEWLLEGPPPTDEVDLEWLLEMTYRVRNNLFHGGKWPFDSARDVRLINAGEAVLAIFVAVRNDLHLAFSEY